MALVFAVVKVGSLTPKSRFEQQTIQSLDRNENKMRYCLVVVVYLINTFRQRIDHSTHSSRATSSNFDCYFLRHRYCSLYIVVIVENFVLAICALDAEAEVWGRAGVRDDTERC